MLTVNQLVGFGAGGGGVPKSFTYNDQYVQTPNQLTYTFSACSIGTADSSRLVVVIVHGHTTNSSQYVTDVTIGGIAATLAVERKVSYVAGGLCMWQAVVPTGTTADIVVTHAATALRCGIGVYSLYGLDSTTAVATASNDTAGAFTNVVSATLTGAAVGDICIGGTMTGATALLTTTWSDFTENYDLQMEGLGPNMSGASEITDTADPPITATRSATNTFNYAIALAAWR